MAKALYGHLGADPGSTARLRAENDRLRRRVADLETVLIGLQAENDRLAAAVRDTAPADEVAEVGHGAGLPV